MAKWHGIIGYGIEEEITPGVWAVKQITERTHFGEVLRFSSRTQSSGEINDDLNISNQISIIANAFASRNFHSMVYVEFMGTKWKIPSIDVKYPRLILTLGGVYNGK